MSTLPCGQLAYRIGEYGTVHCVTGAGHGQNDSAVMPRSTANASLGRAHGLSPATDLLVVGLTLFISLIALAGVHNGH